MSGYSRIGRRSSETKPKISSSKLTTVAKTGRRTEISERRMSGPRWLLVQLRLNAAAVADLLRALNHHLLVLAQTGDDLDLARPALAGAHLAPFDDAIAHDEHERFSLLGHDRRFGHEQRGLRLAVQGHRHEHAWSEQALFIGKLGTHGNRARHWIDS